MSTMTDIQAVLAAQAQVIEEKVTQPQSDDYMPAVHATEWPNIRQHILDKVIHQPRSMQHIIGPSELGTTCLYCLGQKLLNPMPKNEGSASWLPVIGTAVHALLEQWFSKNDRYRAEMHVHVGSLVDCATMQSYDIKGSIDLYDYETQTTIDWKIVGNSTLDNARRHGPSQQYKVQASLYGLGILNDLDINVLPKRSCIYYLPRNQQSLDAAYVYEAEYDPRPGQWALTRAQTMYTLYASITQTYGQNIANQWRDSLSSDPAHCFKCREQLTPNNPTISQLLGTTNPIEEREAQAQQLPENITQLTNQLIQPTYN